MHFDLGFNDQLAVASREFDLSLEFDPHFEPLLEARREVSRLQPTPGRR